MSKSNKQLNVLREQHLLDGEEIVAWMTAQRDKNGFNGVAVVTDRRVIFFRKGMASTKIEPWPLSGVTSVEARRGLVFFEVKLYISGDSMDLRTAEKDRGQEFVDAIQASRNQSTTPPPASTISAAADPMEQIEKLAKLRDSGAITPNEFEDKKQALLARI